MDVFSDRIDKFIDYFVICGLDLKTGLEPDIIAVENNLQSTPLDRAYKCHVLSHYPDTVAWNPFDKDAICLLSLPNGLRFRTQNHNLDPRFHSFIVTKQDGQRCYGFSFVFYEKSHSKMCGAMQTLQAMHLAEISGGQKKATNTNYSTRSLPRHFKIMSQQFSLVQSYYDVSKDELYVSKSIVLISQYPYVHASFQFLYHLYKNWKGRSPISLESYVFYLVNEVKVPAPGCNLSFYYNLDFKVTIRSPDSNELPLCDFLIREIFHLLDVDTLLFLFTSILLEKQVLICSSNYQHLMLVAETLSCLLFPFSWPHVYVPILPSSLQHFLDAPVPFIMGISRNTNLNVSIEANLCFIDLENRTFQLPEDLLQFPDKLDFASDIIELLDQYNIPTHSFFRLVRGAEIRTKVRRSDPMSRMSISSENLSYSLSNEDICRDSSGSYSNLKDNFDSSSNSDMSDYVNGQCFNTAIRELFLNKFLHIFLSYENFIIQPSQDRELWLSNKESIQNFNKVAFLAEQHRNYAFLSQFIETQMFTNFVDAKIQSYWSQKEHSLLIFDNRISILKEKHAAGKGVNCSVENCTLVLQCQSIVQQQYSNTDVEIPPPEEVFVNCIKPHYSVDVFPLLNLSTLKMSICRSNIRTRIGGDYVSNADTMMRSGSEVHPLAFGERLTVVKSNQNSQSNISPAMIAQTNWNFVEKLLKDCKTRTKKMLVAKMGYEAIELGHGLQSTQIEENSHILGLCDLLERIWSHGLQNKKGKSALWFHLIQYREIEERNNTRSESISPVPDVNYMNAVPFLKLTTHFGNEEENAMFVLDRLPVSLINDMKYVATLTDIKTPVGLTKAWVRLSLEKKLLSRHLKTLLSNTALLKSMYKRYAFLRCEDEKEQFLFHLLSLNAVDYHCFTNTYVNCRVPYRVLIHSSTKIASSMVSNCWVVLSGQIGETEKIAVPRGQLEFIFHNNNLGVLTSLRIGQEIRSFSLKWLVDWVMVRNEITGHIYNFACGRWLGRGVDDDSSERLLIGKRITEISERGRSLTPTRIRSPSVPPMKPSITDGEIQQNLSECVNSVVKFYYGKPKETVSIATLLCGDEGLVYHLEQAFLFGFRSTRLFGRNLYIWDFIVKVKEESESSIDLEDDELVYFCKLVTEIQCECNTLGKEGRFQVFTCVSIRDHSINSVLKILSESKIVCEMYEEHSFLRRKSLFYFLTHLLDSLYDLDIFLQNSLTLGISIEHSQTR